MPLRVGAEVVVRTLGNKRGVVVEAGRAGQYRVRVEALTMWCREQDLVAPSGVKGPKRTPSAAPEASAAGQSEPSPPARVDLHGLTVEEAIARVLMAIDRALLRGADRLEVVHGKGSGRIRAALHRHLAALPVVARFRLDPNNAGVTWVYF